MEKDKQRSEELISRFVLMDEKDLILSVLLGVVCSIIGLFIGLLELQEGQAGNPMWVFIVSALGFLPFIDRLWILHSKLTEEQIRLCFLHDWHSDAREILQIHLQKKGFIRCSDVIEAHRIHHWQDVAQLRQ